MSQTMLYKKGSKITCGKHSVDYIVVEDDEVKDHLKQGWVKHPDETESKPDKKASSNGKDEG